MERETGRVAWLEPARGFALFGHFFRDSMRQTGAVRVFPCDFVYAYHVPAQFFVSGMRCAVKRFLRRLTFFLAGAPIVRFVRALHLCGLCRALGLPC